MRMLLLVAGYWLLVAGCWLLVHGYWFMVHGCGLVAFCHSEWGAPAKKRLPQCGNEMVGISIAVCFS